MNFLFKHWLFIFLAALAVVLVVLSFLSSQKTPKPTPAPQETWKGITVGETATSSLKSNFPNIKQQDQEKYLLPSEFEPRPHEITIKEDKVGLIKRQLTTPDKLTTLLSNYEKLEIELYGEHSGAGFIYYVFPEKGILLVGNPNINEAIEIWYFSPTTLQGFLKTWGSNLRTTPPEQF